MRGAEHQKKEEDMAKNGKLNISPLLVVTGAILAPIVAGQVMKAVAKAPATPAEAASAAKTGVYAYGATSAALGLLAGYTTGPAQALATGAALSTGIMTGHAAAVMLAVPDPAPNQQPPPALMGSNLPGVAGLRSQAYARRG